MGTKQSMSTLFRLGVSAALFFTGFIVTLFLNDLYISYQVSHPEPEVLTYQDSLRVKILQNGDTTAYHAMKELLSAKNLPHEIWFYSIVMSKQYHYTPAYDDVSGVLNLLYERYPALGKIDSVSEIIVNLYFIDALKNCEDHRQRQREDSKTAHNAAKSLQSPINRTIKFTKNMIDGAKSSSSEISNVASGFAEGKTKIHKDDEKEKTE